MSRYRANCHCGSFVCEFTLPAAISSYTECNCSICLKKGYAHVPVPNTAEYTVVKGDEADLTSYLFAKREWAHKFCKTCGSGVGVVKGEGSNTVRLINARCIQNLDLQPLKKNSFNNADSPPAYVVPKFSGTEPTGGPQGDEPANVFYGSCHCGAVRTALRSKPFEMLDPTEHQDRVVECGCSICVRGGYVWLYPKADQFAIQDDDNKLSYYAFNCHINRKAFCSVCGIPIAAMPILLTAEEVAKLPAVARDDSLLKFRDLFLSMRPINLRAINGIDLSVFKIKYSSGYLFGASYVNP